MMSNHLIVMTILRSSTLKDDYYWGTDNGKVINGETYEQLLEVALEIHKEK